MTTPSDEGRLTDRTDEFRGALDRQIRQQRQRFAKYAAGMTERECPLCDYYGMFSPFGVPPRLDARCPKCTSLERHRLIWLTLTRRGLLKAHHSVLHFSAEPVLRKHVQSLVGRYVTAEIRTEAKPDLVLNIEAIDLPDASYDRVLCNHVLEHVDDQKALAEMFRVLCPGGMLLLTTPVVEGWAETYEDPKIVSRAERALHFGQADHLRIYGRDLRDRIRAPGFVLEEVTAVEPDVLRFGLLRGETVFLATKPERQAA